MCTAETFVGALTTRNMHGNVAATLLQMMSATGHPDLVTGMTDGWWRLVRKGIAPAFSPANIRCSASRLPATICTA